MNDLADKYVKDNLSLENLRKASIATLVDMAMFAGKMEEFYSRFNRQKHPQKHCLFLAYGKIQEMIYNEALRRENGINQNM